mgnify:FL=1
MNPFITTWLWKSLPFLSAPMFPQAVQGFLTMPMLSISNNRCAPFHNIMNTKTMEIFEALYKWATFGIHVNQSTTHYTKISPNSSSEPHFWAIDLTKWFYWSKTIACMLPMLLTAYFKLPIKYRCKILNPIFFSTAPLLLLFAFLSQKSSFVQLLTSSILWPNEKLEECSG